MQYKHEQATVKQGYRAGRGIMRSCRICGGLFVPDARSILGGHHGTGAARLSRRDGISFRGAIRRTLEPRYLGWQQPVEKLIFRRRRGDESQISLDFESQVRDSPRRLLLFQQTATGTKAAFTKKRTNRRQVLECASALALWKWRHGKGFDANYRNLSRLGRGERNLAKPKARDPFPSLVTRRICPVSIVSAGPGAECCHRSSPGRTPGLVHWFRTCCC